MAPASNHFNVDGLASGYREPPASPPPSWNLAHNARIELTGESLRRTASGLQNGLTFHPKSQTPARPRNTFRRRYVRHRIFRIVQFRRLWQEATE